MMLEHACGLSPSVCSAQSTPSLPPYVPVSQAWQSGAAGTGERIPTVRAADGPCQEDGPLAMKDVLGPINEEGPSIMEGCLALIQNSHALMDQMFPAMPSLMLPAPVRPPQKPKCRSRCTSTEPSRRSLRQATKKSIVLVA
jgi:hypothetical protein